MAVAQNYTKSCPIWQELRSLLHTARIGNVVFVRLWVPVFHLWKVILSHIGPIKNVLHTELKSVLIIFLETFS
jgi:hypothetical protein